MSLVAGFLALTLISSFGIFVQGDRPYVDVNVTCDTDGSVTIVVWNLTDLQEWGEDGQRRWNLSANPECPPTEFNVTTQQVIYDNYNTSLCAASFYETGGDIVYLFTIDAEVAGDRPTQTYHHEYNITCNYGANGTVSATFVPLHEVLDSDEDTEKLTLSLNLNPSSGVIPLGDSITATVTVDHPFGEQLDLLLVQCNISSAVNDYELILGSCPTDDLNFTAEYNCTEQVSNTEVFVFEAFRFASQTAGEAVTVTCEVTVCLTSNASSTCRSECDDCQDQVRRRRDVGNPYHDMILQVTSQPFYVLDPDDQVDPKEPEEEPETGSSTSLIIGLCVGGIAAVAIVCVAVIILTRRRTLSLPVSDNSSPGSYVNQGI